jgi:hypothetical protein
LIKAMDDAFGNPIHVICLLHVEKGVANHLIDGGTDEEMRNEINDVLFGIDDGIINIRDETEFKLRFEEFKDNYGYHFTDRTLNFLEEKLWSRIIEPNMQCKSIGKYLLTYLGLFQSGH